MVKTLVMFYSMNSQLVTIWNISPWGKVSFFPWYVVSHFKLHAWHFCPTTPIFYPRIHRPRLFYPTFQSVFLTGPPSTWCKNHFSSWQINCQINHEKLIFTWSKLSRTLNFLKVVAALRSFNRYSRDLWWPHIDQSW